MSYIGYQVDNGAETEIDIAINGASASWTGNISSPATVKIYKIVNENSYLWFYILIPGELGGDVGDDLDKG